mgnify:CR=1 FL=1
MAWKKSAQVTGPHLSLDQKNISAPPEMTHGGVISAFVDFFHGGGPLSGPSQRAPLFHHRILAINYIAPVKLGETIVGDARIKYLGRSHSVIECHVSLGYRRRPVKTWRSP